MILYLRLILPQRDLSFIVSKEDKSELEGLILKAMKEKELFKIGKTTIDFDRVVGFSVFNELEYFEFKRRRL